MRKSRRDPRCQLVANYTIGVKPLLAIALDHGWIGGRPVFDRCRKPMRELQRLVMRLRRQRNDQVEVKTILDVLDLLEGHWLMRRDVDADLVHGGDRKGIKLALAHSGRSNR